MKDAILVAYATKHGSTKEVCEAVARALVDEGLSVDVGPAAHIDDPGGYRGVVLGSALYMGRAHADARRFLKRHRTALSRVPVAVFGIGPLTTAEKDVASARAQLERALAKTPELAPFSTAIFGGVVDPSVLRFPFDHMPAGDARDWEAIDAWGRELAAAFRVREPAAAMVSRASSAIETAKPATTSGPVSTPSVS